MSNWNKHPEEMEKWKNMLKLMLDEHREKVPHDSRSEREILESMFELLVDRGFIYKKDGKFVLPKIIYDA